MGPLQTVTVKPRQIHMPKLPSWRYAPAGCGRGSTSIRDAAESIDHPALQARLLGVVDHDRREARIVCYVENVRHYVLTPELLPGALDSQLRRDSGLTPGGRGRAGASRRGPDGTRGRRFVDGYWCGARHHSAGSLPALRQAREGQRVAGHAAAALSR
jgi:hypothetical protein